MKACAPRAYIQIIRVLLVFCVVLCISSACNRTDTDKRAWPVSLGEVYPNLSLRDSNNIAFSLRDYAGKVVILEYIGMSCPGCQALGGGHDVGGLQGVKPQSGVSSLDTILGDLVNNDEVIVIQMLLYNPKLDQTKVADASLWSNHFNKHGRVGFRVVVPEEDMRSQGAYDAIPGVQVLDREFRLRFDATGHYPRHNLFRDLHAVVTGLLMAPLISKDEVHAAYRSIPHRQTPYGIEFSTLSAKQSVALQQLFTLTDMALIARTQTLAWFESNRRNGKSYSVYDQETLSIVEAMKEEQRKFAELKSIYAHLIEALKKQREYFSRQLENRNDYRRDPLVHEASQHLRQAYAMLMNQYSTESAHNKKAFFDHLCALDFI